MCGGVVQELPATLDDGLQQAPQPARGEDRGKEEGGEGQGKEGMEIAWRYQKMPQVEVCLCARRGVYLCV